MTVFERIEYLRKKEGISQGNLEKELEMSNGSISKWKTSMPKPERLQRVADHFGVTIDFLMGKTDTVTCKECDMCYNPLDEKSVDEHEKIHNLYIIALEKFGFCYSMEESADMSLEAMNALSESGLGRLSTEELKNYYIKYLKADLSYLLRKQHFNVPFESFKEYAQNRISKDLHEGFMTHDLVLSLADEFEVDLSYAEGSEQLLSRASDNEQLMRILHYAEKLSPEMLNTIEIQLKALAEQSEKE